MARERAAFGGIMGDDGRRAYGLGSIFKKAARAIKKVAKSPIGKAALIGLCRVWYTWWKWFNRWIIQL